MEEFEGAERDLKQKAVHFANSDTTGGHPLAVHPKAREGRIKQGPIIPEDVSYSIIASNTIPGIKRSLDVRLNKKVSRETLQAIALKLKYQDLRKYQRTFIVYYLPDMTIGAGAWATSHFTPELDVQILGLTPEGQRAMSKPILAGHELIGRWLDDRAYVASLITILRDSGSGKLFIEMKFKDNSIYKKEIIEKKSRLGRRFDHVEYNEFGDHWIVDSRGNLGIRDNQGIVATAKKIQ